MHACVNNAGAQKSARVKKRARENHFARASVFSRAHTFTRARENVRTHEMDPHARKKPFGKLRYLSPHDPIYNK